MRPIAFTTSSYAAARKTSRATFAALVMVGGVFLLQACSSSDAVAPSVPAGATPVSHVVGNVTVGKTLATPVRISVTDAHGLALAGAQVVWTASNGGKVSVRESATDANGVASVMWTMGTVAGLQTLIAEVAGVDPVIFGANAVADRAAVVRFGTDLVRVTVLGDTVTVSAAGEDQYGNPVNLPATLSVESGADALAPIGSVFLARNRGMAVVKAVVDTASARLNVLVDPGSPMVTRVLPDTLVAGEPVIVEGIGFARLPEFVELTIGGVRATVTKTSATRIEAMVPSTYGCIATEPRNVIVTVAANIAQVKAPLRTATRLALAKGESVNILDGSQVRCTELASTGAGAAKYVVAVINTSLTAAATSGFELRGTGAGAMAGKTATPLARMSAMATPSAAKDVRVSAAMASLAAQERSDAKHDQYLNAQRSLNTRFGSPVSAWRSRTRSTTAGTVAATRVAASLGDTISMTALFSSCASGRVVRARVVYAGAKALVLEDIASPKAGTMDDQYQLIGDEFDRVHYPLLRDKIGDPLAMNAAMGGDGRVTMLFTRFVNDSLPGIAGYVSACNFYPKSTFAASNEDEVFYARVAGATESPSEWRRNMRSTVVHESKHLASFAIRTLNNTPFEESWLEESLARLAEELYARTFSNGGTWKSNARFQQTVQCELFLCDDRPLMMWRHFSVLHQYLRGVDTLSPIGAAASGDFTYYASGWSLVRWAADQYATDESAWIKSLVEGGQTVGLSNLAQKAGRPAGEMLADWSLTNAVDDLAGFTPARRQLTFPSWNTADVFAGLASVFPVSFVASPLKERAMSFGAFSLHVDKLRAFSSSYFTFAGDQTGSQMLELRGENGVATPPSSLRIAIVRVE